MMTPIVELSTIPANAIWCIGQHSKAERASLERAAKAGKYTKVRAYWAGFGPLKMVFVPAKAPATITLPRKIAKYDWNARQAFQPITGDNFRIELARYAAGKFVIQTNGVDGLKSRACRLAGAITNDAYVGRSKGYTASAAQAEKFYRLYVAGWDASYITRALEAPQ